MHNKCMGLYGNLADFPSPNADAISSSKHVFASRVEGTWMTNLTPTEDMLKWQTSTSDQQESSWICKMRSDQSDNKYAAKFLTNNTLCTLSYVQPCSFFVCIEPTWNRMVCNTMHIFKNIIKIFWILQLSNSTIRLFSCHTKTAGWPYST